MNDDSEFIIFLAKKFSQLFYFAIKKCSVLPPVQSLQLVTLFFTLRSVDPRLVTLQVTHVICCDNVTITCLEEQHDTATL